MIVRRSSPVLHLGPPDNAPDHPLLPFILFILCILSQQFILYILSILSQQFILLILSRPYVPFILSYPRGTHLAILSPAANVHLVTGQDIRATEGDRTDGNSAVVPRAYGGGRGSRA